MLVAARDVDAYWRICAAVQGELDDASVKRRPAAKRRSAPEDEAEGIGGGQPVPA